MLIVIIFIFTIVLSCNGTRIVRDFDQIVLTQGQPIAVFWFVNGDWPIKNSPGWSSLLYSYLWIIQSFWPWKDGGESPVDCYDNARELNVVRWISTSSRLDLKTQMKLYWPSFKLNGDEALWNSAWQTYGLCVANFWETAASDYFEKAKTLLIKYNVGRWLQSKKILPGGIYKVSKIRNRLKRLLNVTINLKCVVNDQGPSKKEQYSYQVDLCFSKQLQLENCRMPLSTSCDTMPNLYYPKLLALL